MKISYTNIFTVAFFVSSLPSPCSAFVVVPTKTTTTGQRQRRQRQREIHHPFTTISSSSSPAFTSAAVSVSASLNDDDDRYYIVSLNKEEIDLELLSLTELGRFHKQLERLNLLCTEDCTQTEPICDVVLKDERDSAMIRIENLLQEWNAIGNDNNDNDETIEINMSTVRDMVKTPWMYPFEEIRTTISKMETLNCECTEEGNQTNKVCDVTLKDERDTAIETLNLYMKSVQNLIVTSSSSSSQVSQNEEQEQQQRQEEVEEEVRAVTTIKTFDMDDIRDCALVDPGRRSIDEMKSMVSFLERQQLACTEDSTQTNAECDIELKHERDTLMELLVKHINDVTNCLNGIKTIFSVSSSTSSTKNSNNKDNAAAIIDRLTIDDVRNTVIDKVIPNLPTSARANAAASNRNNTFDEYLVQI